MSTEGRRNVLRAGAAADALLALFLLSPTWDRLYTAVGLPPPRPVVYAQLAGAVLAALAYLQWAAPADAGLARRVAGAASAVHLAFAVLLLAWRGFTDFDVGGGGTAVLISASLALVVLAALEARVSRSP